jgi:hypothetical protein
MATWITHLRLADNLAREIPQVDLGSLYVGSIAPDSGIPDEDWETFDPPIEISHFGASNFSGTNHSDLDFYRDYLAPHILHEGDKGRSSFLLGYFFHIVTDNLWWHEIGAPTKSRFKEEFANDPEFIWEVKGDWYGLDFRFLWENPDWNTWQTFLNCGYAQDYLDFMPRRAVQQRLEYIKEYYSRRDEKIEKMVERPFIYLSRHDMDRFVQLATEHLLKIYSYIWVEKKSVRGNKSALELPIFI